MSKGARCSALAMFWGLVLVLAAQACGLKADPAPKRIKPLQAPADVRLRYEAGDVSVQWRMSEQPRPVWRFRLYRSEAGTDGKPCAGCPPDEARIADLAAGEAALVTMGAGVYGYTDRGLKADRLYRYRVIACDRSGLCSEPSEPAILNVAAPAGSR